MVQLDLTDRLRADVVERVVCNMVQLHPTDRLRADVVERAGVTWFNSTPLTD